MAALANTSPVNACTSAQPAATGVIPPLAAPTTVAGDPARRTSPSQRSSLPTPLYIARLMTLLPRISNRVLSDFILNGLQHGFPIGHSGASVSIISGNLPTAIEHAQFVQQQIADRVRRDESAGPFSVQPFHPFVCFPLGVVPKTNGKFRLIHHLSYPDRMSVNDGMNKDSFSLHYVTVDDAIELLQRQGTGALMAKLDIRNAFRLVPVAPTAYRSLGFQWQGQFYHGKVLPFGLRSALYLFNCIADALCQISCELFQVPNLLHLLDDFWLCGPAHSTLCAQRLNVVLSVFRYLGVPIADEKTVGPTSCLTFLGIELDSVQKVARLPQYKVDGIRSRLLAFRQRQSCRLRELEQLLGKLNFASRVISPGRTFMRRLYDATRKVSKPYHRIRLSPECHLDLLWWSHLLDGWNGKSFFLDLQETLASDILIETDASGAIGHGAVYGTHWLADTWSPQHTPLCITFKELYPICIACATWGHQWCRKRIRFHTDNEAVAAVLKSGTSRCPNVMSLLRQVFFISARGNFMVTAGHIP
ncbi:uncharacterized protein LOC135829134 [Sycon ciliatum]|uniref:uncharacterized protein LOC135829134 n=1 Tax=Sycon ciliatum TaxID=27933 RepID=UPI0031F6F4AC